MNVINQNLFFIKEHIGMFKAANNYDILNPESQELIMTCREDHLGGFTKLLRFTKYKRMTPFNISINNTSGDRILSVKKGISFFRSTVEVFNEKNILIGKFKQKFFTIGGKFDVLDENNNVVCALKGKWTSWEFSFIKENTELARVTKKWAGLGKELFTTADNYMLKINESVPANDKNRLLILAAVMCIDMVLKE